MERLTEKTPGFCLHRAAWLPHFAWASCLAVFGMCASDNARADAPHVRFDVSYVVACRDVTPPEFAAMNPGERLVEAAFHISSLLNRGSEGDLSQLFFQIESPEKTVRVVDHLPRTELFTPYAGTIAVEKRTESGASIGLSARPNLEVVSLDASAQASTKRGSNIRYEMLPPQELLAASGTVDRERGVYFKLKPSSQTSLEGSRQFIVLFRVPAVWRGDVVHVHCRAEGIRRGLWRSLDTRESCGGGSFLVTLYTEGDEAARRTVANLVRCEERLREQLVEHRAEVIRGMQDSRVPGYATLRNLMEADQPRDLFTWVVSDERSVNELSRLPEPVGKTLRELRYAVRWVRELNGSLAAMPAPGAPEYSLNR